MENKIYYIQGSSANPEGVRQALLDVCPDAENIDDFAFEMEEYCYYVINGIIDYAEDDSHIDLLKVVGTELEAKKIERFVEKTMYHSIYKGESYICNESYFLHSTMEEAINQTGAIGYRAVKVMVKEGLL